MTTAGNGTDTAIAPAKLAHIVIRSHHFDESIAWWTKVFGMTERHRNEFIAFLTYDDEHHRLAIVRAREEADLDRKKAGFEHVAFTYGSLDQLLATYERLKAEGITPVAPINHGMTLSMYYADPDGHQVELQVDSMDNDEAEAFMASDVFAANPIGVRFDPDDLVARRAAGESIESLLTYVPAA